MSITDQAARILDTALQIHREFSALSAKFESLEKNFDRVVESNERLVTRLNAELDELRGRLTTLESMFKAIVVTSTKEAMLSLQREHLERHGQLAPISLSEIEPKKD